MMAQRTALWSVPIARPAGQGIAPTDARGASGPKPKSGTVGPKIATVGVPIADARCIGAESFVTITRLRPINSADASSDRRPVASSVLGAAATMAFASSRSAPLPTTMMRAASASASASCG
jgi:hypothetical protein